MLNFKQDLVEALTTILPTYSERELYRGDNITTPCITYQESNDYSYYEGDTLRYSRKQFTIKISNIYFMLYIFWIKMNPTFYYYSD